MKTYFRRVWGAATAKDTRETPAAGIEFVGAAHQVMIPPVFSRFVIELFSRTSKAEAEATSLT